MIASVFINPLNPKKAGPVITEPAFFVSVSYSGRWRLTLKSENATAPVRYHPW